MSVNSYLLPSNMTIGNIGRCHAQLFALLDDRASINVDLAELKQIDTSGIQMLLLFVSKADLKNISISWVNSNQLLEGVLAKLGFENSLIFH